MKHWFFFLFLCVGDLAALGAVPFEQAEVTKTVNRVSLLPRDTRAVPGDVIKGDNAVKTGGDSRAELQFPDLTITRVGSNALFRFLGGRREITLDGGTMLFSSPKGAGGGKVQAGAITAAVTGTDFLISIIKETGDPASAKPAAMQAASSKSGAQLLAAKQKSAMLAANLSAFAQEAAKLEAAKLEAAKQNAKLADKLAAAAQNVAKQDTVGQNTATQAVEMAAMQEALKQLTNKQQAASNVLAKQAATLAKITQNVAQQNAATQPNATQEAAQQKAVAQQAVKLDSKLDLFTQAAAQQEAANQKINELTNKLSALRQEIQQLTGTKDAVRLEAAKQEYLQLLAAQQETIREQQQAQEMTSNMVAKMGDTMAKITQNIARQDATMPATPSVATQDAVKVIGLTGKVLVYFTQNPKESVTLGPGQMVTIPGGATKMPPITTINLGALISTS
ncbi:MAG: FecR domain-containing protein, partial [Terrimicrobiaceae bacterium]